MIISVQSVYCNFVLKIILFFVSGKLEKILGAGRAQQEIFVVKSAVVCDPLRGFSQICQMQKMTTNIGDSIEAKIRPHIGGQVLHPTNLRKSSERVTHNKRFHYISLLLCMTVTRSEDFLKFVGCKT